MPESLNVDIILEEDTPNIDVDVESQAAAFSEILRNDTLTGDGIDTPLGVNTNAIATVDTLNQGLATKQGKGDYALKTELPTKISTLENDSNYTSLTYVQTQLSTKQDKGDYVLRNELNSLVGDINTVLDNINGEVV